MLLISKPTRILANHRAQKAERLNAPLIFLWPKKVRGDFAPVNLRICCKFETRSMPKEKRGDRCRCSE
jgi:hypothetical protein